VYHHVFVETDRVSGPGLDRQGDSGIAPDVVDLSVLGEVSGDDLIAVETDPHDRHLGPAIGLERDQVREAWRLQDRARGFGYRGHRRNLAIPAAPHLVPGSQRRSWSSTDLPAAHRSSSRMLSCSPVRLKARATYGN
jgi:hypothetical protein